MTGKIIINVMLAVVFIIAAFVFRLRRKKVKPFMCPACGPDCAAAPND